MRLVSAYATLGFLLTTCTIWLKRNRPPPLDLSNPVLRFGILGAARVAPNALITPAKTHPDVVVAAVACRDKDRGAQYAQKYKIPRTFSGPNAYQSQYHRSTNCHDALCDAHETWNVLQNL